jgi:4-oxalocrotonate tautomerase
VPLARIDLIKGQSKAHRRTVGDVVYDAMVEVLKAPKDDRFQVISEHDEDSFIYDPHFFGIERSKACIFIQLYLREGRTLEQKQGFYKKVTEDLKSRINVRPEDVFITLVSTAAEDWSFGNGVASLVK